MPNSSNQLYVNGAKIRAKRKKRMGKERVLSAATFDEECLFALGTVQSMYSDITESYYGTPERKMMYSGNSSTAALQ